MRNVALASSRQPHHHHADVGVLDLDPEAVSEPRHDRVWLWWKNAKVARGEREETVKKRVREERRVRHSTGDEKPRSRVVIPA